MRKLREMRGEISSILERITRLRAAMESTTHMLTDIPRGSAQYDKLAEQMAELDAMERQLEIRKSALELEVIALECKLDSLPEPERVIMRLRYVDGLKWEDVAQRAGYSLRNCTRLHRSALSRLR